MTRPIILGVVGDSAAGKTTITRGLVRILGEDKVTHVCTDDYHRYDREQRAELGITPLHPECNYIDIIGSGPAAACATGDAILKPVYSHADGTFGPPVYVEPERLHRRRGAARLPHAEMRDAYDVRVYLAPPEELRRKWKVQRDCSRRGYTTDQVLAELDRREPDSAAFIRPQERHADMVVSHSTRRAEGDDRTHLDAELTLREGLPHPDLSPFIGTVSPTGITFLEEDAGTASCRSPATSTRSARRSWRRRSGTRLHFAPHLRSQRLGEFTIGIDLHRSESLALVQLIILYHLVTARATVSLGGEGTRAEGPTDEHPIVTPPASEPSAVE